jgi:hypothetical protein
VNSAAISPEKQKRISALRKEGLTLAVIAERLGLHLNTIEKYCGRLQMIPRRSCGCPMRGRRRANCSCRKPMRMRPWSPAVQLFLIEVQASPQKPQRRLGPVTRDGRCRACGQPVSPRRRECL